MENTIVDSIDFPTLITEINQGMQTRGSEANGQVEGSQLGGRERWEEILTKVRGFRDLEDDWDGLGAKAPDPALVESAIRFAGLGQQGGMATPAVVVPGLDGSVIFDWQTADVYMEVEICKPGYGEFMKKVFGYPSEQRVFLY